MPRRVRNGFYDVRFKTTAPNGSKDVRHVSGRRKRGRFFTLPAFDRRSTCSLVQYYSLGRSVFGGRKRKDDQSFKRWDILVQATPVGLRPEEEPLVSNDSFLRCFNFVYDLVPAQQDTILTSLARQTGVPSRSGVSVTGSSTS